MICDNDGRPYPRDFIANQLNIPQELLDRTIVKCMHEGRIDERDDVIIISNWANYQSEYDRVKKYREKPAEDPDKFVKGKYGHMVQR